MRFMCTDYYTNEICSQGCPKEIYKFCNGTRETLVEKNPKENIASKIDEGFTILAQDESIFTADAIFRKKMWVKKGSRPIILVMKHTPKDNHIWCIK